MNSDILSVALVKDSQRFVWLYTPETRQDCLRSIGRFAANLEIDFTWADAAKCAVKMNAPEGATP